MTEYNLVRIKSEIMLRVRFLYVLKKMARPFALEVGMLAVVLFGVGRLVFVAKVFENAPDVSRVYDFAMFFVRAFANTETLVQVLVLGTVCAVIFALKDFARTVSLLGRFTLKRA